MSQPLPQWLASALHNPGPGHSGLIVAQIATQAMLGKGGLTLTSAAFADGEALDPCFTADEEDSVAPPLEWNAPAPGTQELVLIVEDPDTPEGKGPACHWLVWGLPGQKGMILEGEVPLRVGKNAAGNSEWLLPDPPTGADSHDYVFQLFALDLPLVLMPGASRKQLVEAMKGHVTGVSLLTGKYSREEGGDYDFDAENED